MAVGGGLGGSGLHALGGGTSETIGGVGWLSMSVRYWEIGYRVLESWRLGGLDGGGSEALGVASRGLG